jgi:hypothetical protein
MFSKCLGHTGDMQKVCLAAATIAEAKRLHKVNTSIFDITFFEGTVSRDYHFIISYRYLGNVSTRPDSCSATSR